jgi:putative membrane protein
MEERSARTEEPAADATRRTHLANERTYLAWWRTGLASLAVGIGVGRVVPELSGGRTWPYAVVGGGYALLGIALIAYGSHRRKEVDQAVTAGRFARVDPLVSRLLGAFGLILAVATLALVVANP